MESIYCISINTNMGSDFYLELGNFLDSFYRASHDVKAKMIIEPPTDMGNEEYVPFLAATADKLSIDYGLPKPIWAFDKRCYLTGDNPFFGCRASGNLKLLFMYKSPVEFKHRNLFVDENVLMRV